MGTKHLGRDTTPHTHTWLATCLRFFISNIPGYGQIHFPQSRSAQLHDTGIELVQSTRRTQKTLNNGQYTSQGRNADHGFFPVLESLRTRQRSHHLNTSEHCPLSVCTGSKMAVTLLNSKHIAAHLQTATKSTHRVTAKE